MAQDDSRVSGHDASWRRRRSFPVAAEPGKCFSLLRPSSHGLRRADASCHRGLCPSQGLPTQRQFGRPSGKGWRSPSGPHCCDCFLRKQRVSRSPGHSTRLSRRCPPYTRSRCRPRSTSWSTPSRLLSRSTSGLLRRRCSAWGSAATCRGSRSSQPPRSSSWPSHLCRASGSPSELNPVAASRRRPQGLCLSKPPSAHSTSSRSSALSPSPL
mmetsp:Transcript_37842/g.110857  ORF Transcript_37842/g.110857 Transcript_37842/m.110857 type:complete len:212 (-) Transcript_37842:2162-2797(-)